MELPADFESFVEMLRETHPPQHWPAGLCALWHEGKGDWEAAHEIAQDIPGVAGSWIHAYLHRVEGDRWNAGYWYERAGRPFPSVSHGEEFEQLVTFMLRR